MSCPCNNFKNSCNKCHPDYYRPPKYPDYYRPPNCCNHCKKDEYDNCYSN
ncbi:MULTISPECIES: hypothetical protein [Clostridium]|uniref:Uncharacterized protein n=1 Tax=Clostridium senegalense TaxID=1465809 RepID=A0A6M0H3D9_9CLOT|nr:MULTISPECIES: hypothetical protein [Clostridium]NEU05266.1 hypothetical protein [Clostridium senegalense]